ncbi:hypothetical protein HHI36_007644 [Cryptolaemus montrouzieri]|uniref:Uncharacterized protein n=1 Tax=Cryptolaemus montrouzieri TaxID=559131 RepID=A0ABD2MQK9_9CUCU
MEKQGRATVELRNELNLIKEGNVIMKGQINMLIGGRSARDRTELENNVIIDGLLIVKDVPKGSQMKKIVTGIGRITSVNIFETDFECETISRSNNILRVKFKTSNLKEKLMKAKKDVNIKTQDVGLEGNSVVYKS